MVAVVAASQAEAATARVGWATVVEAAEAAARATAAAMAPVTVEAVVTARVEWATAAEVVAAPARATVAATARVMEAVMAMAAGMVEEAVHLEQRNSGCLGSRAIHCRIQPANWPSLAGSTRHRYRRRTRGISPAVRCTGPSNCDPGWIRVLAVAMAAEVAVMAVMVAMAAMAVAAAAMAVAAAAMAAVMAAAKRLAAEAFVRARLLRAERTP